MKIKHPISNKTCQVIDEVGLFKRIKTWYLVIIDILRKKKDLMTSVLFHTVLCTVMLSRDFNCNSQ
jgi:hypothetical protein